MPTRLLNFQRTCKYTVESNHLWGNCSMSWLTLMEALWTLLQQHSFLKDTGKHQNLLKRKWKWRKATGYAQSESWRIKLVDFSLGFIFSGAEHELDIQSDLKLILCRISNIEIHFFFLISKSSPIFFRISDIWQFSNWILVDFQLAYLLLQGLGPRFYSYVGFTLLYYCGLLIALLW